MRTKKNKRWPLGHGYYRHGLHDLRVFHEQGGPIAAKPQPKMNCRSAFPTAQWLGLSDDLTITPEERDALFSKQVCWSCPWRFVWL
jgi:hypothetical protein